MNANPAASEMGVVYKGDQIEWDSVREQWTWKDPRTNRKRNSASLSGIRKAIDQAKRPDYGFSALLASDYTSEFGEFEEVAVLGFAPGTRKQSWRRQYEVRFKKDGSIHNISPSKLLSDTKENRSTLKAVARLQKKKDALNKQIDEQRESLTYAEMPPE